MSTFTVIRYSLSIVKLLLEAIYYFFNNISLYYYDRLLLLFNAIKTDRVRYWRRYLEQPFYYKPRTII